MCVCFIRRETDVKGINAFSKCKMYDVNWTTIQSWDYENWNSTKHHEKLNTIGKYWQVTKLNKWQQKQQQKNGEKKKECEEEKKYEYPEITFALSGVLYERSVHALHRPTDCSFPVSTYIA